MKKLFIIVSLFAAANASAQDFYMQKQNEIEFKRLNQEIMRLKQENEQRAIYMRQIEQQNEALTKKLVAMNKRIDDLLDLWVNFENVSLPNLVSADKALANRINDTNNHIKEQTELWNWGEMSRECKDVGTHQQVKTVLSKDGQSSTRYLCFDGKVLHLNTVSNIPPIE
tara:strand:+ start:2045 stop:2551 length:507 start_codon:yes stop_codon:yes gene_type:complete